ncbi:hypothetical protein B0J13DRAFT_526763 [Dactylonectria estremocensis]|uniref:Uncharacterized protein n=1 Tax=Dactylonectria estremocensis TaxID=1079267 RepID=A0A9P9EQF1_9HYPO|nr:hypothetical protein B0J13DRAFT_526763 [Dactylonectria estremocensis]
MHDEIRNSQNTFPLWNQPYRQSRCQQQRNLAEAPKKTAYREDDVLKTVSFLRALVQLATKASQARQGEADVSVPLNTQIAHSPMPNGATSKADVNPDIDWTSIGRAETGKTVLWPFVRAQSIDQTASKTVWAKAPCLTCVQIHSACHREFTISLRTSLSHIPPRHMHLRLPSPTKESAQLPKMSSTNEQASSTVSNVSPPVYTKSPLSCSGSGEKSLAVGPTGGPEQTRATDTRQMFIDDGGLPEVVIFHQADKFDSAPETPDSYSQGVPPAIPNPMVDTCRRHDLVDNDGWRRCCSVRTQLKKPCEPLLQELQPQSGISTSRRANATVGYTRSLERGVEVPLGWFQRGLRIGRR